MAKSSTHVRGRRLGGLGGTGNDEGIDSILCHQMTTPGLYQHPKQANQMGYQGGILRSVEMEKYAKLCGEMRGNRQPMWKLCVYS